MKAEIEKKMGKLTKETEESLFDLLYKLEDKYSYDETELGITIGNIVNKLQNELLKSNE